MENPTPNAKNPVVEVYSLAFGGDGVGKINDKVCFIQGAVPGDKVEVEITKDQKTYSKGRVLKIVSPSSDRVNPKCEHYQKCGGCQLQHLSYEKELECKQQQVSDLIKRISGLKDIKLEKIEASDKDYNYRSTITLHRSKNFYGFHSADKHIIGIKKCEIAENPINIVLPLGKNDAKQERVTVKSDIEGRVWHSYAAGERFYKDKYNGMELFLSPKSFSQCNRYIASKIADTLNDWIEEEDGKDSVLFDLYSGNGFFTFLTKKTFSMKIGIENDRTAINAAKTTMKENNVENIKFFKTDVESDFNDIFKKHRGKNNIVILDPPRKGASKRLISGLKNNEDIKAIYYISCDPSRLARDIKAMTENNNWKLNRIKPLDMFPKTKHIEVLAEIIRT